MDVAIIMLSESILPLWLASTEHLNYICTWNSCLSSSCMHATWVSIVHIASDLGFELLFDVDSWSP